jgi:hypothetical protein
LVVFILRQVDFEVGIHPLEEAGLHDCIRLNSVQLAAPIGVHLQIFGGALCACKRLKVFRDKNAIDRDRLRRAV